MISYKNQSVFVVNVSVNRMLCVTVMRVTLANGRVGSFY